VADGRMIIPFRTRWDQLGMACSEELTVRLELPMEPHGSHEIPARLWVARIEVGGVGGPIELEINCQVLGPPRFVAERKDEA